MSESIFKRLYGADNVSGFEGNRLTEEDFNNIIKELLLLNQTSSSFSGRNNFNLGNGVFGEFVRGFRGLITEIHITTRQKTKKTPLFPDADNQLYSNPDIKSVDITSDYILYNPDGTTIDKTTYSLYSTGEVYWAAAQTETHFMIDNLIYETKTKIVIGRNANGGITGFDLVEV